MSNHLWISCVNVSKQNIVCTGFAFNPNRFRRNGLRVIPNPAQTIFKNDTPKCLQFSERLDQHFKSNFFTDENLKKFLSNHRWIAKIQLKLFWRVIATTNIKEFSGRLSNSLIEETLKNTRV